MYGDNLSKKPEQAGSPSFSGLPHPTIKDGVIVYVKQSFWTDPIRDYLFNSGQISDFCYTVIV